ncbi:MAG: hypothetical protein DRQ55_02630 [Planctomycetota bacterium]|nr:MAG: hypothetical protein DRQ55_02630 [Planctomycetota bacterium]
MRTPLLPTLVVLVLVGLVLLLPDRKPSTPAGSGPILPGSAAAGQDLAMLLSQLPQLELTQPPDWAQSRGVDAVARHLDRLEWAGHAVLVSSRQALGREGGKHTDQILARLADLGPNDPILLVKLIALLGDDPDPSPRAIEELVGRALSNSAYVARAALKVLAYCPDDAAIGGILPRLHDADNEVRAYARAALAERVRRGDPEARAYLLDELERTAADPDLAFVTVLGESDADERGLALLQRVVSEAGPGESMAALASLLVHDDPESVERVEAMLAGEDLVARINGLRMAAMAGNILGQESWVQLVAERDRSSVLALMSLMVRAINSGHESALLAVQLLEQMAVDPAHPCQSEALDALLQQEHPIAVERTRNELQLALGAYLGVTVDRLIRAEPAFAREFAPLAEARLDDPATANSERICLCRLLSSVAPELAAPRVVRWALEGDPALALPMISMLGGLGSQAVAVLAPQLEQDRAAGLLIFMASTAGTASMLPLLEAIVLDERHDQTLRIMALDAMVRLDAGPREAVLRRVAKALDDPEFSERARLLFWNYL